MKNIEGGCLCGRVRYIVNQLPQKTVICHCVNCQKQSGSAFSVVITVDSAAFTMTGEVMDYPDRADSGAVVMRRFCGHCGSPLVSQTSARPAVTIIKAGTLDDTGWLRPKAHVWCRSAQPWVAIDPALPRFDGPYIAETRP